MVLSHVYSPYLGRYVLSLVPQVDYMAAVPRTVEVTPLVAKGSIETCSFPDSAEVGVDKPWSAKVHNTGDTGRMGLGIGNASGNPGNIVLTWQGNVYTIDPGNYLRIATVGEVAYCTRIDTSGEIAFQTEGSYTLRILGLHLDGTTWYYDDERQIPVTVTTPEAPWPITRQYPYENIVLNPGALLEDAETRDVGPVDKAVLLGAVLDYKITYQSGVLKGVRAWIYWNDEEIAYHHLGSSDIGVPVTGTVNLGTGRITSHNTLKVKMIQGPLGFNVVRFDIVLTLGYSEEPAEEPKPGFPWPELAWWHWAIIGGVALGVLYIVVVRPAPPTVITVPYPVLRPKEGE